MRTERSFRYIQELQRRPNAWAAIRGSREYPGITGLVRFYQTCDGVLVAAEVSGLPWTAESCGSSILGFHLHSGEECDGNSAEPFASAQGHYNPKGCPHPGHAGDLPPLFSSRGNAFQIFLTDRFAVREVIGKTVIIHDSADDFTSQPGGNAGARIACGIIISR